jgi:hypothetical protein
MLGTPAPTRGNRLWHGWMCPRFNNLCKQSEIALLLVRLIHILGGWPELALHRGARVHRYRFYFVVLN